MVLYVFDMDGTLTPPRLPMSRDFAVGFNRWQKTHKCFVATGSDYAKIEEQLPPAVIDAFTGIYCSMGNVLKTRDDAGYVREYAPPHALLELLENFRKNTKYTGRLFPNYIERRTGMVNFSVLGRDCPYEEREKYAAWDKISRERLNIQTVLSEKFPELDIAVGGSISIDITPKGRGKEQIAAHLRTSRPDEKIVFFGDRTFKGGNDYELSQALRRFPNTEIVQVDGPEDIEKLLDLKDEHDLSGT